MGMFRTPFELGDTLVVNLRGSFSIWSDTRGYYWFDAYGLTRSYRHFETVHDAIEDCRAMLTDTTCLG